MEPQDTPPYAPLDEVAAPASDHSTSTPTARTDPAPDERIRTRRLVAAAAGAAFLAAMTGMAIARSGSSSASTTTTSDGSTSQVTGDDDAPSAPSFDDGFGREPRAAQPAVPFSDGDAQTQS